MVMGRVTIFLVLVALPTTFAETHWDPHTDQCQGVTRQLQDVLVTSGDISVVLRDVAADAPILPKPEVTQLFDGLQKADADIRANVDAIHSRQDENVKRTRESLELAEDSLQGELLLLQGGLSELHVGQKVLQQTLGRARAELSQDHADLVAGSNPLGNTRRMLLGQLRLMLDHSKLQKGSVADLIARLHALENCAGSLCR